MRAENLLHRTLLNRLDQRRGDAYAATLRRGKVSIAPRCSWDVLAAPDGLPLRRSATEPTVGDRSAALHSHRYYEVLRQTEVTFWHAHTSPLTEK